MAIRLTERDLRLLVKCAICRWLTTDQLRRLYFPDATLNAVQKRLRKLSDAGYLRSHQEHRTAQSVHTVGPKGKALVEERGVEVMALGDAPGQPDHLWGVNELRIAVEQGRVPVDYFFAYWELTDLGWKHSVIPDALFAMRDPVRRAFVVEYDRGTETLDKLLGKLKRYAEGIEGFPFDAVLIVTEETRRLDLIAREMRHKGVAVPVLAAPLGAICEAGLWDSVFVQLPEGVRRALLVRGDENDEH